MTRNVKVEALEYHWLLMEPEGRLFVNELAKTNNIEVFGSKVLRYYIDFMWSKTKPLVLWKRFFPFLVHFVMFILYSTVTFQARLENKNHEPLHMGLGIVCWLLNLYGLIYDILKIVSMGKLFLGFWNISFFISLVFNAIVVPIDIFEHLD